MTIVMVAASILPITIYKNKLHFLFGKENPNEDSAPGWSDFGGRIEKGETPYQGALREGAEELSGFLGNEIELKKLIKKNGGTMKIRVENYHIYLFYLDYDESLINYFNMNHYYMYNFMKKQQKTQEKLAFLDKIEIQWFSLEKMENEKNKFRHFYREIVNILIKNKKEITEFAKS